MSFDITSRHTSWGNRLFIEASAGTGKTFVIEHYLVRSALFSTFCPEELALITFTRAVANELKIRLRRTFEKTCSSLLSLDPSPHDYLIPVLEGDDSVRKRAIRTLEEVKAGLPSAVITTIHGFCDKLMRAYAESIGEEVEEEWLSDYEKRE
jgi:exodeoxyribonuclease V beta subunit